MAINFSPERWRKVRENCRKWWAGKLKRPLIIFSLSGYEAGRPQPKLPMKNFTAHYDPAVSPEEIVDRWDYELSCQKFVGDGFPNIWPNFGAGVVAAFQGCKLHNRDETVWFHNDKEVEISDLHIEPDPDAFWFRRVRDIMKAAADRWKGVVQVNMTDLGGTLDIISSFRPSEKLLLDLYDYPDEVKRVTWEVHKAWWYYFDELTKVVRPPNQGYTAWTPIFSEEPYYMLQCDFAYMIGPDMFDEFVMPELSATCKRLKNAFYHLDGVGQLPHLDSLLSIPELKGIQWIPGSGKPDFMHWPEVYKKIRNAGKLIQVFGGGRCNCEVLDVLADQLGTAEGVVLVSGTSRSDEKEVEKILGKYL